jgi:hypothetical protein
MGAGHFRQATHQTLPGNRLFDTLIGKTDEITEPGQRLDSVHGNTSELNYHYGLSGIKITPKG